MGGAMARGWKATHRVLAYDPVATIPEGVEQVEMLDPTALPRDLVVVLAVKPQMFDAIQATLAPFGPETLFVSLMAGISLNRLRAGLGEGKRIVRTMPNTPAAIGRGITAAFAGADIGQDQRDQAEQLLRVAGDVVWLSSESDMDIVTAVSGSGPAYFYRFTEALARAGTEAGLPADLAMRLARATFTGAGALAEQREEELSALRVEVTSPGGTTAAGLAQMDESDRLDRLVAYTVRAAADRSRELGQ
jgi:pyrroline-5-carboxylate reductase